MTVMIRCQAPGFKPFHPSQKPIISPCADISESQKSEPLSQQNRPLFYLSSRIQNKNRTDFQGDIASFLYSQQYLLLIYPAIFSVSSDVSMPAAELSVSFMSASVISCSFDSISKCRNIVYRWSYRTSSLLLSPKCVSCHHTSASICMLCYRASVLETGRPQLTSIFPFLIRISSINCFKLIPCLMIML